MKLLAASFIGTVIGLLMAFAYLTLTGQCKDSLGGPLMGISLVLAVLLAVGATEWLLWRRPSRHQDTPPTGENKWKGTL